MTAEELKAFLQQVFRDVLENPVYDEEIISQYFDSSYLQYVDHKVINYEEFFHHLKAQKAVMESVRIRFEELIAEDNKIVSIHYVKGKKKTGEEVEFKVIAMFQINPDHRKIILCNELTMMIHGGASDRDLGSRTTESSVRK